MAEPSIPEKIASSNQNAKEAFLKTIDVIMEVGKLAYEKGAEEQKIKAKDCSDSIELQTHEVKFGYYHTSIRITPKSEEYKDDPRFKQVDEAGRHYTTLGAGPTYNTLVHHVDRPNDIGPHPNRIPLGLKNCKHELMLIEHVLDKDSKFKDVLDYDLFPAEKYHGVWYWADDGYNSNSFISGLIDAANLEKPDIDLKVHPGWNKPVPIEYFRGVLADDILYRHLPELEQRQKALNWGKREEAKGEYKEKFLFDYLYKNDNVNSKSQSENKKHYNNFTTLRECEASDSPLCEALRRLNRPKEDTYYYSQETGYVDVKPIPELYNDYKKQYTWKQYSEEKDAMLRDCKSGRKICESQMQIKSYETFSREYDTPESKRQEIIKDVFDKIDDFKKSDAFKFIENQVDGVTKILPKF
ncbi:MAG: hypothetical protein R3F23_09150 [Verrucomicrobiia bacterium]